MASKFNWQEIERAYTQGVSDGKGGVTFMTQRELAAKFGCAPSLVARHCKQGQWAVKRERFVNKVGAKCEQKKAETLSDEATRFDLSCFNISQEGVAKAKGMLADCTKPGDFAALTKALKDLQAVAKTAIGDGGGQSNELSIEVRLTDED